jgi:UDP-N-acetylmuramate--alanine ligase
MIKVGIFFGGRSREREISFAGGRTVYDNLDKALFSPVPLFIDSLGKITLLDWQHIYKGTIRDFFPGPLVNHSGRPYQVYADSLGSLSESEYTEIQNGIGKPIAIEEIPQIIDIAFLTLHGPYGEDGSIQGILDWLNIPFTGSGIFPSAFGINKTTQRRLFEELGFEGPRFQIVSRNEFLSPNGIEKIFQKIEIEVGFPCVVKAPHQGSSIGVGIVKNADIQSLSAALYKSFFLEEIKQTEWKSKTESDKIQWLQGFLDVRTGVGLPVSVYKSVLNPPVHRFFQPEELLTFLDSTGWATIILEPDDAEDEVLIESFIEGKEFSCIVVEGLDSEPIALPPTEIIKYTDIFDYRSKYLPGISRKITPIDVPLSHLENIRSDCERMYKIFGFQVYARLDGFIKPDGKVILNDPNTTSGMLPSSFFFHQSAEIGLNPSQFLTYIIFGSLRNRMKSGKLRAKVAAIEAKLEQLLAEKVANQKTRIRVGVVMGGYSTERHISMESGRNIFEKLSSSDKYLPIPLFLTGSDESYQMYKLPVKMMLKDNADDVKYLVENPKPAHPFIENTIQAASSITKKFASDAYFSSEKIEIAKLKDLVDEVFIALHGRPGEDGSLQEKLEAQGISYNGSGVESSRTTINKYETNALLRTNGILVAGHRMVYKSDWQNDKESLFNEIEKQFTFPFIAKPSDDGCSSAVKKIKTKAELAAFSELMFRETEEKPAGPASVLNLKANEEFPQKQGYLIETLIEKGESTHFLEITGGMLTKLDASGKRVYEIFEPSETLASGEVLSLEEKFLAGEGQNITPARFSKNIDQQNKISAEVRKTLQKTAEILNVEGYCRIDAFVRIYENGKVETIIIEINSLPGMTPATCIFHQAAINHLKPVEFIDSILEYGKARNSELAFL